MIFVFGNLIYYLITKVFHVLMVLTLNMLLGLAHLNFIFYLRLPLAHLMAYC